MRLILSIWAVARKWWHLLIVFWGEQFGLDRILKTVRSIVPLKSMRGNCYSFDLRVAYIARTRVISMPSTSLCRKFPVSSPGFIGLLWIWGKVFVSDANRVELLLYQFLILNFVLIKLYTIIALYVFAVFLFLFLFVDFFHLSLPWVNFEIPLLYVLTIALSQ